MLEFNTYEELFNYKTDHLDCFTDCIFRDKTLKISYNGTRVSLYSDYDFYVQILQKITEIFCVTNKFSIYTRSLPETYGIRTWYSIQIEKRDNLIIGTVSIGNAANDVDLLLNNLPELNILNVHLEDSDKLKYLTNPPVSLQEINIIHRWKEINKTIGDFMHLFGKIPFGCSINLKYNNNT
jgi:hypothetical protein